MMVYIFHSNPSYCFTLECLGDLENAIVKSSNPLLKGAVDYLVEEEDAEEELFLGQSEKADVGTKCPIEKYFLVKQ